MLFIEEEEIWREIWVEKEMMLDKAEEKEEGKFQVLFYFAS